MAHRTGFKHWLRSLFRRCENCGRWKAYPVFSRTEYPWDGIGEDPNRELVLCAVCELDHDDYWDEMWREYYDSRL